VSVFLRAWNLREAFRRILGGEPPRDEQEVLTPDARRFLTAMSRFCHADQSCVIVGRDGHIDTHATALAEGHREVFLEMVRVMKITDDELFALRDPDEELPT
jgi:hypothetical protein